MLKILVAGKKKKYENLNCDKIQKYKNFELQKNPKI